MTMYLKNQITIIYGASSHNELLAAAEGAFAWFKNATAGTQGVEDIEAMLEQSNATVAGIRELHETMLNEWKAFAKTLTEQYGNFSRDIVHRLGVDEQSQVRNLALNIAGSAFNRLRENARAHLVRKIEGIRD